MSNAICIWRAMPTATPLVDAIAWNPCGPSAAITAFTIAKIADGSAAVPATAYSGMRQITGTTATVTLQLSHSVGSPIRVVAYVSPTNSFAAATTLQYVCPSGITLFPVPPEYWIGFSAYDTSESVGFATSTFTVYNASTIRTSVSTFTLGLTGGGA